jgi:hypothetical protein
MLSGERATNERESVSDSISEIRFPQVLLTVNGVTDQEHSTDNVKERSSGSVRSIEVLGLVPRERVQASVLLGGSTLGKLFNRFTALSVHLHMQRARDGERTGSCSPWSRNRQLGSYEQRIGELQ